MRVECLRVESRVFESRELRVECFRVESRLFES